MASPVTNQQRIQHLAVTFPSLRSAPGVFPWVARELDEWAASFKPLEGVSHAASFVLHVWSPDFPWDVGRFHFMEAIAVWDSVHRDAFLAWAKDPWWIA